MPKPKQLIRLTGIESRIHLIRGQKVMFDADLAELYCVETKALNKAVQRNRERFPDDFMFQLEREEVANLRFQIGTSSLQADGSMRFQIGTASKRNVRFLPYVFTREGIAMLSGVLRSERAVAVNIEIMRAFVRLQQLLATQADLLAKLTKIEKKAGRQDKDIRTIFNVLKKLMSPPEVPRKPRVEIGFHTHLKK